MYPPYSYDMVVQRRDELLRLAEQARREERLSRRSERREHRSRKPKGAWRAALGARLVRAGRAVGGDDAVRTVLKHS